MALITNLISYWKFDSSNSNDSVGSANGTDTAITYSAGNGKINVGAGFNGTTSKITMADAGFPSASGARTISLWFKVTSIPTNNGAYFVLFAYGTQSLNNGQGLALAQIAGVNNVIYYGVSNDVNTAYAFTTDTWYHYVVTFDGTNANQYINGSSISGDVNKSAWTTTLSAGKMGVDIPGTGNFHNGAIDEVGIWSRVLSTAEITQLYNGGAGLQYPFGVAKTPSGSLALMGCGM